MNTFEIKQQLLCFDSVSSLTSPQHQHSNQSLDH